jgi:hypothetical protein
LKIAEVLDEDVADILEVGQKNIFNNQTNQGNGMFKLSTTIIVR